MVFPRPVPASSAAGAGGDALKRFEGTYFDAKLAQLRKVTVDEDGAGLKISGGPGPAFRQSGAMSFAQNRPDGTLKLEFEPAGSGDPAGFALHEEGMPDDLFARVETLEPSTDALDACDND